MKNLKYILILIGILIPGQILLHAEVQDSTTVIPETATIVPRNTSVATSEPDTIAEKHGLSRKKYKRGLKNISAHSPKAMDRRFDSLARRIRQ